VHRAAVASPRQSVFLSHLRYRIDTVFSQLTEQYSVSPLPLSKLLI
jgi:hypothetical protein